jgi:hypothetical protein
MRYVVPVLAVIAVVTTGQWAGWSKGSNSAESQVEVAARQYARLGMTPTSGYRISE